VYVRAMLKRVPYRLTATHRQSVRVQRLTPTPRTYEYLHSKASKEIQNQQDYEDGHNEAVRAVAIAVTACGECPE